MKHLSLMIILISIFIAGCSVAPIEEASPSLYKETKENIAFEIQLNDNEFDAKSDIIITATITNVGNKAIGYYSGSSSCVSHLGINIISKDTGRLLMKKPPKEIITCTEDIGTAMLEPQQSAQEKKVFLPIETMPSLDGVAASGEYEVKILFFPTDRDRDQAIRISLPIEIHGSDKKIISEEKAEEIADNQEEVSNWIKNHSGDAIAKENNGEYYILFYDGWVKTSAEEYNRVKNVSHKEEKSVAYKNERWNISYQTKLGAPPNRIEVTVDAVTEEVISVETLGQ